MNYQSTRGNKESLTAAGAVIKGIANDRGLFVPSEMPKLKNDLKTLVGKPYQDVAKAVIGAFFTDYTKEEIAHCVEHAYDCKFEEEDIVPIAKIGEAEPVYFLELYHGKTAAFKDMALSILPYLLTTAMKKEKEDKKIAILTATSGDTGKAALEGFADVENTEILVFYPEVGVSEVQKRQMNTQEGKNTHVFAIRGNFDDAQTGVKNIFGDKEFALELQQKGYKFSSANSINIGRLVPQVAYYVYSYVKLLAEGELKEGEKINIAVPTGNFGNILAAYYAKYMGVPVEKFICASNENQVLTDFINTGVYDIKREFHITNSPSMDILISSNLERLLYHLSGGDGAAIAKLMEALEQTKSYQVEGKIAEGLKSFYGGFANESETLKAIGEAYKENGYLMDTHTAVAYSVYKDYVLKTGDKTKTLIASTASAYKFAQSAAQAIDLNAESNEFAYIKRLHEKTGVRIPAGLQSLENKEIKHKEIIDVAGMKSAVWNCLK